LLSLFVTTDKISHDLIFAGDIIMSQFTKVRFLTLKEFSRVFRDCLYSYQDEDIIKWSGYISGKIAEARTLRKGEIFYIQYQGSVKIIGEFAIIFPNEYSRIIKV
jgi:hypothetical protein